jgi:hypothetical protein
VSSCVVLIPVYKPTPSKDESFSISHSLPNLLGFDVKLLAPESLDVSHYEKVWELKNVSRFPDHYFKSVNDYSRLLLNTNFYDTFVNYEFILVCQPDAIVLKPELQKWIDRGYDYIGAPWKYGLQINLNLGKDFERINPVQCSAYVGNGGFSLRKIKSCTELINQFPSVAKQWVDSGSAEDLYFSLLGTMSLDFKLPNFVTAANFAHETDPEFMHSLTKHELPFGVHAWEKHSREHWNTLLNLL